MSKKRALVLAGGGLKVAYQAGALQVLLDEVEDADLKFDHADGASGGMFNLAMWIFWALFTVFGFVASLKRMAERATERYCARRKLRRARAAQCKLDERREQALLTLRAAVAEHA